MKLLSPILLTLLLATGCSIPRALPESTRLEEALTELFLETRVERTQVSCRIDTDPRGAMASSQRSELLEQLERRVIAEGAQPIVLGLERQRVLGRLSDFAEPTYDSKPPFLGQHQKAQHELVLAVNLRSGEVGRASLRLIELESGLVHALSSRFDLLVELPVATRVHRTQSAIPISAEPLTAEDWRETLTRRGSYWCVQEFLASYYDLLEHDPQGAGAQLERFVEFGRRHQFEPLLLSLLEDGSHD